MSLLAKAQIPAFDLRLRRTDGWGTVGSWLFSPHSPETVFLFFADAANLEALTPPWPQFEILTPLPIRMCAGALIEYRLRLHGI